MSLLNLPQSLPVEVNAFSVIADGAVYQATWAPQNSGESVEIWHSATNDRATATLQATVSGTVYRSANIAVGAVRYVWARRKNTFGFTGPWNTGPTAGTAVTITGIPVSSGAVGIVSPTTISGITYNTGSTLPSTYNTWTEMGNYIEFTAPTGAARLFGFAHLSVYASSMANSSGEVFGAMQSRMRVRNHTTATDLAGMGEIHTHTGIYANGTSVDWDSASLKTYRISLDSGFGAGGLIPGNVYRIHFDLRRLRTASTLTFNTNYFIIWMEGAAEDSASIA